MLKILDFGKTPLADLFVKDKNHHEPSFPLLASVCKNCFLFQLTCDVDDTLLFGNNYAFYTGGSPSSIPYFKKYADDVIARFPSQAKKFTLEIASNDGTLLKNFSDKDCKILGIDPAKNVVREANKNGINTIEEYFNTDSAKKIAYNYGKAGIVIANNVLAHVIEPKKFVMAVKKILDKDGIFIFECQYFPYLLFNNQFDNIYHEHRSFFSLTPLKKVLTECGLKIIDIEEYDTQGGSIRVFATHKSSAIKTSEVVKETLKNEVEMGILDINTYLGFRSRIEYIKIKLVKMLNNIKKDNKKIAGYGASAKSSTLLNYCKINTQLIDYIVDKTPYKFGLYTPGTHIPVVGSEKNKPDYYLLLVWNYAPSIMEREREFRMNGGKFIIALPTPHIV